MGRRKGGEQPTHCQNLKCQKKALKLWWYKQKWVCDECMLGPMTPLKVEDFVQGVGQLGDDGELPGEKTRETKRGRYKQRRKRAIGGKTEQ